jgi:dipeptidyl aminopeptidase/acylaminoacyl peptidase
MRYLSWFVPVFCLSAIVRGADIIPVEDFAHLDAFAGMTLSPDGRSVAYVQSVKDVQEIVIRDLDAGKNVRIEIPASRVPWVPQQTRIGWVNSHRLIFSLFEGGFSAVERDGSHIKGLTGYHGAKERQEEVQVDSDRILHFIRDEKDGQVLMTEYNRPVVAYDGQWVVWNHPNVMRMNSRTAAMMRVEENPGNVEYWVTDANGVVRVALESQRGIGRTIHRENENAPWLPLPGMDWNDTKIRPLGMGADNRTLYVNRKTPAGTWAVYPYDLVQKTFGEALIAHEHYDIIPEWWRSFANGVQLQDLVYAPDRKGGLLGVRFLTEFPRVVWFDEGMAGLQAALDAALPRKINSIISLSDDRQRVVVQSWAANDPGTFYLYDAKAQNLSKLLARMPWIDPAKMAEVAAIKFKSRDGLSLRGYLTLPPGRGQKNLPMIVMPHGGPQTRDVWGYDPDVQFLANRGYAVLQVDYRGSAGYGDGFFKKGLRQVGTGMQQDITDGVRWAIRQGIADEKRIGIMGGSFGGYSALMGLVLEPDLYKCGISIAGVTDWATLIKDKAEMFPQSYAYNLSLVGNPKKDAETLEAISPVHQAGRIKAPVLIIHGRDDPAVPFTQAKLLVQALEKAGRPHELMSKYNEQHGLRDFSNRVEMYRRVEAFLQKHLPAAP